MGEIQGAIMAALQKAGVDCGYEIQVKLLNNAVMHVQDAIVSSGSHFIVPEAVAKQDTEDNHGREWNPNA
jgi:hypothetical protein